MVLLQALSWAASRGQGRLVRILLDRKADVKLYSSDGQSPSDIAYTNGYTTVSESVLIGWIQACFHSLRPSVQDAMCYNGV